MELKTLGDHLRKVRLDLGLSQPDVAEILKVTDTTITRWELNRNHPTAKYAKAIIDFIGYFPITSDGSLGKQLYYARLVTGKTQADVAKMIGCDESNLRRIELDRKGVFAKAREKIEVFIYTALYDLGGNINEK